VPIEAGQDRPEGNSWHRPAEVEQVMVELRRILPALEAACPDFDPEKPDGMVGVIAFYSAQATALQEALEDPRMGLPSHLRERVRVDTVDAFQGREYEVVLLSTVRSNREEALTKRLGFTVLPNRLCVAFSRARNVLVVVGDAACLAGAPKDEPPWSPPMHAFLELCRREGYVARNEEVAP
jgi:superfamily I DNA and/or RNA helicase